MTAPLPTLLSDYTPPPWRVDRIDLLFEIDVLGTGSDRVTRVTSVLEIRPSPESFSVLERTGSLPAFILQGEEIALEGLLINGEEVDLDCPTRTTLWHLEEGTLSLSLPGAHPHRVTVISTCRPEGNKALMGLYQSSGVYCTQCEAEGFQRITWFPDRPDILSVYTVRIEAPRASCPVLLSNGNRTDHGLLEGDRHFAVWHDPHPKPCYLFALVAGELDVLEDQFVTRSGRSVALQIFVEPGKVPLCTFAMASLKKAMSWDEQIYGREYDLDIFMIVAVSDFNMGAMENKGLNIFNDKYILSAPDVATDQDYANIESVIAHEYFHNWTGNRITCRDWFQLCLKEGLTVFRDQQFSIDHHLGDVQRIQDIENLRAFQFPEDQGPLQHPVRPTSYLEINNFYTATVYEKGAEICRMLFTLLGPALFYQAMELYFDRYDGQAVTIEDFIACFAEVSGRDLTTFFRWYTIPGTPKVTVLKKHDDQGIRLTLTQDRTPPLHIPLHIAFFDPETGKEQDPHLIELTETTTTLSFPGLQEEAIVSCNRQFSAPILLEMTQSPEETLFLMQNETQPFARFEASQTFARTHLLALLRGEALSSHEIRYLDVLKTLLSTFLTTPQNHAFLALLLDLPKVSSLLWAVGKEVDPVEVYQVRKAFKTKIARQLYGLFEGIHAHLVREKEPYAFTTRGWEKRQLMAMVLSFLASGDPTMGPQHAFTIFETADNMSDRMASIQALSMTDTPERDRALSLFFEKYAHKDRLLLDKWFAIQAQIPDSKAISRVRSLMEHPSFSWSRPNGVRALVATFASSNILGFHDISGEGYRLLGEVISKVDGQNPQIAARLCTLFKIHPLLEPRRKKACTDVLEAFLRTPSPSRDLYDVVSRLLA